MTNLVQFPGAMTGEQRAAFETLDEEILRMVEACKEVGVAQGLIVALLHAHALQQTQRMIDDA